MVKILTLNIAGLSRVDKRLAVLHLLKDNEIDVACLQEITFSRCQHLEGEYKMFVNLGPKKRGTAVLVRHGLQSSNLLVEPDGRLTSIDVNGVTYIGVYAPSGCTKRLERRDFFSSTVPAYYLASKHPAILMGDFNAVEDAHDRRGNLSQPTIRSSDQNTIKELIRILELKDIWKTLKPTESGFTRHTGQSSARIDRIYANSALGLDDIKLGAVTFGDHLPVMASITPIYPNTNQQIKKNYGLWKLNASVLSEERYITLINNFIVKAAQHPLRNQDIGRWWEQVFKPGVKKTSIKYCAQRAREKRNMRAFIQDCLLEILSDDNLDWARYQELRRKLKAWENESLKGYFIRSRIQDGGTEEAASLHHVKRCKRNDKKASITELYSQNGVLISHEDDINREIIHHFTFNFKSQRSPDKNYAKGFLEAVKGSFNKTRARKTQEKVDEVAQSDNASPSCHESVPSPLGPGTLVNSTITSPISIQEISRALIDTHANKAPGIDGIPYEFNSKFWVTIGPHFLTMVNYVLENGSVLASQGKAAIRLIPKTLSPKTLSDYRPISLLNCDYKLIASVLANRLRPTLVYTLGEHQKGGVPGRYISDSLCLYRDIIDETSRKSRIKITRDSRPIEYGAAIIGFDLEKAYDLVNRDVLWEILKEMGYPQTFISWLRALYSTTTLAPLNGKRIVGDIDDVQSIRQGCPLSIHLFAPYIEPLLTRLSLNLDGIELNGCKVAVRGYVDDLAVFAASDYDIVTSCKIIDEFCQWTHARVNKSKSQLLGLGAWDWESQVEKELAKHPKRVWPVQWLKPVRSMKLLGINFTSTTASTTELNWENTYNKMVGVLTSNAHRNFTLYGRVIFIKQHVLSLSVYLAHVLPCPSRRAEALLKHFSYFVFRKGTKPARGSTLRPLKLGGLGIPNPLCFFHSLIGRTMFKSLIGPEGPERSVLRYWLALPLRNELPNLCNNTSRKCGEAPPFHVAGVVPTIKALLRKGTITPLNHGTTKLWYESLIETIISPGLPELQRPKLDWQATWRWVAATKGKNRDTLFLFNHNILPTQIRNQRRDATTDSACPICRCLDEDNNHLVLLCPEKKEAVDWLRSQLSTLGCTSPMRDAIHGNFGNCPNPRRAGALIEAFIVGTWEARQRQAAPPVAELEGLWKALLHQRKLPLPPYH